MSLVREANCLRKLTQTLDEILDDEATTAKLVTIQSAVDYVVGFNMKGLHKIEKDLFFPWVKEKTCDAVEEKAICSAITDLMEKLESDRQKLELVGAMLVRKFRRCFSVLIARMVN